ncbi:MAG: hypothetical protein ACI90C_000814, partial [Rhodoferax sp.]
MQPGRPADENFERSARASPHSDINLTALFAYVSWLYVGNEALATSSFIYLAQHFLCCKRGPEQGLY